MSIATAITAAQGKVADCYTAISNKGGTLPATQNLSNMPTAISSITTSGTIDSLSITPSTSAQTITASGGVDGYSPISVSAVDSSIDANITAGNIKSGVSILGVSGSVTPLNGTTLSVTPSTSAQSLSPSSPYNGYTSVSVSAVTSSIDNNITAGNIKSGVSILGVIGTYGGGGGSSKYGCTVDNLLGDVDANGLLLFPTDTSGDIVFTGVKDISGYALYSKFYNNTNITGTISFPDLENLTKIASLYACFRNTRITSISFPKLKIVSGSQGMYTSFYGTALTNVEFPELTTVSGTYALYGMLQGCYLLTTASFPKLQELSANYCAALSLCQTAISTVTFPMLSNITGAYCMNNMFIGCDKISSISFPALTTASFGSYTNQFNSMFNASSGSTSGAITMHFPSNLSSTISSLTGYPNFGATAGRLTLSFDLPATS